MYSLIITTCTEEDENKITDALLKNNLAACVSSFYVNSSYIWKDAIEKTREKLLFIKTQKKKYKTIEKIIKSYHSYETPEILCIDIACGYKNYLKWISETTN
jgi:periplasmic divalent cation tolerance protein